MSETDKQTAELLKYLQAAIEKGGDFVGEQAPLLAQEIVTYGRVSHTAGVISGLLLIVAAASLAAVCVRCAKAAFKKNGDECFPEGIAAIISGCSAIVLAPIGLIATCGEGQLALLAWCAPRLYILEYLADKLT